MKKCNTCKEIKDKSLFYKRKASKDGLCCKCIECQKVYDKRRLRNPKRMKARRDYQKTKTGAVAHKKANKIWIGKNPIKRNVHVIIGNAIRSGKIIKNNCEVCGSEKSQAHHCNYNKPFDIKWLCALHHKEWHTKNGEGNYV